MNDPAITPAAFAVPPWPLSASDGPVIVQIDPPAKRAVSGPAKRIKPTSRRAGEVQLLVCREVLAAEIVRHKLASRCKAASVCEAELMRLNHLILRAGIAQRAAAVRAI